MKKALIAIFALCTLLLTTYAGMVSAYNPAYPTTIYSGVFASTIDGYWTTSNEWSDAAAPSGLPANLVFRNKYSVVFSGGLKVYEWYLVEFFGDNTNDAGDYVQICFDSNATGSTAPKTTDLRIDYVGHGTLNTYIGTGTGWTPAVLNDTTVAQSLNVSRLNSNAHWITEFRIEKIANGLQLNNAIRIAVYDASNPSAGVISFPPTSEQDVPNSYSLNTAAFTAFLPAVRATAFSSVTVLKGWTWYFFAHSKGGVGARTYQWYDAAGPIAGQTSMVLPVMKTTAGTYAFFCRVTDSEGQVVNTNNVTLTVR